MTAFVPRGNGPDRHTGEIVPITTCFKSEQHESTSIEDASMIICKIDSMVRHASHTLVYADVLACQIPHLAVEDVAEQPALVCG